MINNNILFWQPKTDVLRLLTKNKFGQISVIVLNYVIWIFLFYISYLLIRFNTNLFWQILVATLVGETVEKYGKSHALWRRPLFMRNDTTPVGLVDRWYKTGSFPSGHTIKAIYFLLFLIQYPVFPLTNYLFLVIPLLFFRVIIGFHYPIDMVGGFIFGIFCWLISFQIVLPEPLTHFIRVIFNFVFRI